MPRRTAPELPQPLGILSVVPRAFAVAVPIDLGPHHRLVMRRADNHAHLVGEHHADGGLTQARRAVKEEVIEHVSAALGGLNHDLQALFHALLADIFRQVSRT